MKYKLNSLITVGKFAYFVGMLLVFNFLFGWIFLRFFFWLVTGLILIILLIAALSVGKKILFKPGEDLYNAFKRSQGKGKEKVIDIEAEVLDQGQGRESAWHDPVYCPFCYGRNTRFVEPHYEASIYECNSCRRRFEIEE